jgi:hypothetical protein
MIAISGWGVLNEAVPYGETKKAGMTLKTKRVGDDPRIWRVE